MARKKKINGDSWLTEQVVTPNARRVFEQERLVVNVTNSLVDVMQQLEVSRAELARRLDCSRAYVTQLLAGTRNMTLHTLADMAWALSRRATFGLGDLERCGYRPLTMPQTELRARPELITQPMEREQEATPGERELAANAELDLAA